MKTVAMCFSIFQAPKCRVHTLASSWFESFHSLSRKAGNNYGFRIIGSSTDGVKGKHSKAYNTRPISTKSGANKKTFISKTSDLIQDISDGSIEMGTKLDISNSEVSEFQRFQYGNVQQKTERSKELAKLLTIIVFDIETTGFSKDNDRIIEIALQDLLGGKESTFQTMVNPERYVPNQHIHGISTYKVHAGCILCRRLPIRVFRIIGSSTDGVKGKHSKAYNTRPISTKSGANKKTFISKTSDLIQDISDGSIEMGTKLDISNSEVSEFQRFQYGNVQQKTERSKELAKLLTIIVFDIETTGFSKDNDRIIEISLQDLLGGKESTFQTMVNPERYVPNQHIHGISTYKVNRPDVPRMQDLIPILMQYVKSRQKTGGQVLWIAHNARTFDVPFLIKEFSRCNFEIPLDWIFLDTIPLAREMMKLGGSKQLPPRLTLEALRKFYEIPLVGQAHRALSDVNTLSLILQRLTFDLKLPIYGLIERSFTVSDLIKTKKKKSGG